MDGKEHIITLGRLLAEEQRRGCDDTAVVGGLTQFIEDWRADVADLATSAPIMQALDLLEAYDTLDTRTRNARLTRALGLLRALFTRVATEPMITDARTADARPSAAKKTARPTRMDVQLDAPLESISGVGRATAQAFRRLGVRTVRDLVFHFPYRHDDYSSQKQIGDLQIGSIETLIGVVDDVRIFAMRNGGNAVEIQVSDETGVLKAVFFRQPWLQKQFQVGARVVLSGKIEAYMGTRKMTGPDWELYSPDERVHTGRLVPVYPLTRGLVERSVRSLMKQVVDLVAPQLPDHLPARVRERAGLMSLGEAVAQVHFPTTKATLEAARKRLGFDEFLFIQLGVLQRKVLWQGEQGVAIPFVESAHRALLERLPFALTGAQSRALEEIFRDMARAIPMARLLQGDVGSGKTAVAAAAALQAVANGYQAAIMAPTEILAEQHAKGLRALLGGVPVQRRELTPRADEELLEQTRLLEIKQLLGISAADDLDGAGVRVALLTGSLGAKERRRVLDGIARGEVDLVVGTHALITEHVQYARLGMVVIDEQHRFGVEQRRMLKEKGFHPHMLVMTATPIPRTLTLTIYGDLDTSVLDELPPGRQEIRTRWITSVERDKAYRHMRREIAQGRQAFVVCPLVDESEKIDAPSAEEMYARLATDVFPDLRVALLHGKMQPREKDAVMVAFRNHNYDILVATAVIEVGIDVPNATTVLIEGADRFGLAQLHQFRGRVGRGRHQSYCILVSDSDNDITRRRLEALEQIRDGFKLAEIDLELRGPGEFFGTRQSGTPDLKMARLADTRLLYAANAEAREILREDPELVLTEHAMLRAHVDSYWSSIPQAG